MSLGIAIVERRSREGGVGMIGGGSHGDWCSDFKLAVQMTLEAVREHVTVDKL